LNTSRIGQTSVFNTSDGNGGLFDTLINDAEQEANDVISNAADKVAEAFNLTDFYAVHIMDYCQGFYKPNATVHGAKKNTTHCSSRKTLFHFDPTKIVEDSLPDNVGLSDLHWPNEIQDASRAVRVASIVMFVFYVIGIAFAGFAVITALLATFTEGRVSAFANFLMDIVSFLLLIHRAFTHHACSLDFSPSALHLRSQLRLLSKLYTRSTSTEVILGLQQQRDPRSWE
jgi:SUR7/PalI family